jgi:hypothetical protein
MATYICDGNNEPVLFSDLQVGLVVRHEQSDPEAHDVFSDCVITEITGDTIHLTRPYMYVATGGAPLVGMERFKIQRDRLLAGTWRKPVTSRGTAYKFTA